MMSSISDNAYYHQSGTVRHQYVYDVLSSRCSTRFLVDSLLSLILLLKRYFFSSSSKDRISRAMTEMLCKINDRMLLSHLFLVSHC